MLRLALVTVLQLNALTLSRLDQSQPARPIKFMAEQPPHVFLGRVSFGSAIGGFVQSFQSNGGPASRTAAFTLSLALVRQRRRPQTLDSATQESQTESCIFVAPASWAPARTRPARVV